MNVVRDLRTLPPAPSPDAVSELIRLSVTFTNELADYSKATPNHLNLYQSTKKVYIQFLKDIQLTVPRLTPWEKKDVAPAYSEPKFLTEGVEQVEQASDVENTSYTPLSMDLDDVRAVVNEFAPSS